MKKMSMRIKNNRENLKQQISTRLVIVNQLFDFDLEDINDELVLTFDEKYEDKALAVIKDLKLTGVKIL